MPYMGIAGQLNGPHRDSNSRSRSVHTLDKEETDQSSQPNFVPPRLVEEQLSLDENLYQDVRSWLVDFGELKPGTDVSLHFKINQSDLTSEKPFSLLPLLTRWVRSWFEKSLIKSAGDSQDRNSLTWLLQYVADYVDLGHCSLNQDEVHDLCLALLDVCLNARQQSHLESCLLPLLAVARIGEFPKACLKDVLITLSSANVVLDKPLLRAGDVVKTLATGGLQKDTIADLFAALITVARTLHPSLPDSDLSKHLNPARGAVRYISALLEVCGLDEKPVINIKDLFDVLLVAAETGLLRLATEILDLLTESLKTSRVDEVLGNEALLATLLDIYDLCKKASIIPDSTDNNLTKTKSAREEQTKRERRYKRDLEQSVSRFKETIVNVLPMMDTENAVRAWREVRDSIQYQAAHKRANALEFLKTNGLCLPYNPQWADELHFLLDKIVVADTTEADEFAEQQEWAWKLPNAQFLQAEINKRTQQRIDVLRLCAYAIEQAATPSPPIISPVILKSEKKAIDPKIGTTALEKLLSVLLMETNSKVIDALLQALVNLSATTIRDGSQPYASLIISKLEEGIAKHAKTDSDAEAVFVAATETLRTIFVQGLAYPTSTANRAYEALLRIADCKNCKSLRCRLISMSVLIRLRCDTSGLIYIENHSENAQVASAICKTSESLAEIFAQSVERSSEEEKETLSSKHRDIFRKQLWMYPAEAESFAQWSTSEEYKTYTTDYKESIPSNQSLDVSKWVFTIASNLQQDKDWETYSYILVHLGSQMTNTKLFEHSQELLHQLRGFLCGRVRESERMFVPPQDIALDKADVALCFFHILVRMIPYYKMQAPISKYEGVDVGRRGVDIVRAFREGISKTYEGTSRACIHALSICCFEIPEAIASEYAGLVNALTPHIYRPHLSVHILEFIAQVARLPRLHSNFREPDIKAMFYICIRMLQNLRESGSSKADAPNESKQSNTHPRRRALQTPYRNAILQEVGLRQYSSALSYHSMIFWFLSIPLGRRDTYVKGVTDQLVFRDSNGQDSIDEQTLVLIDMMQRSAFSDLSETSRNESFAGEGVATAAYVVGNSIVTIETNKMTGVSQVTKRQASGTTHAYYEPNVPALPAHQDTAYFDQLNERGLHDKVAPSHTLLNMIASAVPIEANEQPLKLNLQEDYVNRGIRLIDLKPSVDSHRIGVVLLKDRQIFESEYLANTTGTKDFEHFLNSIGTRVSLHRPCDFVPWGLQEYEDGTETIAWRDRINEIVYEVATLMPNTEDEYQARKKSHIGNCFVLVVFNQSNQPWEWKQFASQVTMVQIVITPANRVSMLESSDDYEHEFYQIEVFTKDDLQKLSSAAETKVVSKATLAPLARMLALNANIFSECARSASTGDSEFPSSWRYRLQEIIKLKERTQQRIPEPDDATGRRYDFSRWT